jgi:putative ABC transport system ATP-binding protein
MEPTIRATDIQKSFGAGARRQPILRGVGLEAAGGETVYLVGPSGSGKTTLLSILGCILTPDEGRVQIRGQDVASLSPAQLTAFRGRHLGFIFQTFNLFPTLSALDNVRLALSMQGVRLRAATVRAAGLLDGVGLGTRAALRPGQLSTGECQRVAVARALAADPAILLADEPTAALDADNGQAIVQLLHRLVPRRGGTLVVVTHDERIFPFADRILRLEDGHLAREWSGAGPGPRSGKETGACDESGSLFSS